MTLLAVVVSYPEGGVIIDSAGYLALARLLVDAGNYLHPAGTDLIWPPGYPLFIDLASLWRDPSPVAVAVVQMVLTGVVALLLVWLGTRVAGQNAGLAAGWLYALSPNAAFWAMTVMSETAFASLLALGVAIFVLLLLTGRETLAVVAGLIVGAASFVRPAGIPVAVIWAALLVAFLRRSQGSRSSAIRAALLLLGCLAIILPWMVRNQVVHSRFVFSDVAAQTFYGFNVANVLAEATGISRDEAVLEIASGGDEWAGAMRVLAAYPGVFVEQQLEGIGRMLVGVESGVWARQLGLDREYQGSFGVLAALRAGRLDEAFSRLEAQLSSPKTALHAILFLYGAAFTLGVWGLIGLAVLRSRSWPPMAVSVAVLVALTVAYVLVSPGAAGQARFRISVEPLLALLAGFLWASGGGTVGRASSPEQVSRA